MRHRKNIRQVLLTGIISTVFLAGAITAFFNYYAVREQVEELFDAEMAQMARLLQSLLSSPLWQQNGIPQPLSYEDFVNSPFDTFTKKKDSADSMEFTVYGHNYEKKLAFQAWDRAGNLLIQTYTAEQINIPPQPIGFNSFESAHGLWHIFALVDKEEGTRIQVAQKEDVRTELTMRIAIQQTLAPLVITPVVALLIWYIVGYAFGPLKRLSDQVSSLNIKNLQPVGSTDIPAEIQVLVGSLNELFARVRNQAIRERRFSADVAHELRTPLAALKIQLQNSMRRSTEEPAKRSLQKAETALDNMVNLVELLLLLNKLETSHLSDDITAVHLASIISDVVALLEARAKHAKVRVNVEIRDDIVIEAHSSLMQALIRNLLENALKHSPAGESVEMSLADGRLMICDHGPGIPEEELKNIFQRFYRVEGDASAGSGLGLSICEQIVSLYGFSISLENRKAGGSGISAVISFNQKTVSL